MASICEKQQLRRCPVFPKNIQKHTDQLKDNVVYQKKIFFGRNQMFSNPINNLASTPVFFTLSDY